MAAKKTGEKKAKPAKKTQKKGKSVDKWKKKQWYNLIAPNEFDRKVLGETVAEKPKNLEGRIIKVDLGTITGQRQKRHISILFKVKKVEGNSASCEMEGHEISHGFMNRLVRRRMSKIESVQNVKTGDGKTFKVKAVALSVRKLSKKQETSIRKKMDELMVKSGQKKPSAQFSQEIVFGAISSKAFKHLKKIAPLKRVEIIKSRLIEGS